MTVSSANTTNLQSYLDGAAASRAGLTDAISGVMAKARIVASGCSYGGASVHSLNGANGLLENMQQNETFVAVVRNAVLEADRYGGNGTVSDSVIEASLHAYGVATRPAVVEVAAMELLGLVPTSGFVDDPICAANGNFVHGDQDLCFPGFARLLDLDRVYNSLAHRRVGSFGHGWTSVLDQRIAASGSDVDLHLADGAVVTFRLQDDGTFLENRRRRLHLGRAGDGWIVRRGATESLTFDSDGQLVAMRSLAGSATLARAPDVIEIMEERSGRWIRYHLVDGLVWDVEASDGRVCSYAYEDGDLVRVERAIGSLDYRSRSGLLVSMADADGVVFFDNEFSPDGVVRAQRDVHGRRTTYQYDATGVTVISGGDGQPQNRMVHDRHGNLVSMIDGLGEAMHIEYDVWGNRTRVIDRCRAATSYEYDDAGELVCRTDPDGLSHTWRRDQLHRIVEETDRAGHRTIYTYAGEGRSPEVIERPDGGRVLSTYDARELPIVVADADGVTAHFEWNRDGQLAATVDGAGGRTTFAYDAAGIPIRAVNPSDVAASLVLDDAGRAVGIHTSDGIESISYTRAGRPTGGSTPAGDRWTATYASTGDVARVLDAAGNAVAFIRDDVGQVVALQTADGAMYRHEYDPIGRVVAALDPSLNRSEIGYDREGRPTALTDAVGRQWTRELDLLGRTVRLVDPSGASSVRSYHANGSLASLTDEDGNTWAFDVDPLGRCVAEIDPLGGSTRFSYSKAGRLLEVRSPMGRQELRTYDAAGRLATVHGPDGSSVVVERRADGKVAAIDEDGRTTLVEYDDAGRVESVRSDRASQVFGRVAGRVSTVAAGPEPSTYEWDPRGLLERVADPAGIVTALSHDARGRVVSVLTGASQVTFGYDASGWLDRITDPYGAETRIARDAVGLPRAVEHPDGRTVGIVRGLHAGPDAITGSSGDEIARFERTPSGELAIARNGSGAVTFERDVLGRPVVIDDGRGAVGYAWDADGLLVERVDPDGLRTRFVRGADGMPSRFVLGDKQEVEAPSLNPGAAQRRDGAGRLLTDQNHRTYAYDDAGRLVSVADGAGTTVSYGYDDVGLLSRISAAAGETVMEHGGAGEVVERTGSDGRRTTYEYDRVGRRTAERSDDGASVGYEWDDLDQLVSVTRTSSGGSSIRQEIVHDALGLPTMVHGVEVRWDRAFGGRLAGIGDDRFLWFGTLVHRIGAVDGWYAHLPDDPWGHDGGTGVRCGYRGALAMDDLVFFGERVYDTTTRSFLTRDPLPPVPGALSFAGPYSYAWNDPVNFVDPTGRRPLSDVEYQEIRKNLETSTFSKAWNSTKEDPWGALAMAGVVVVGAALCFTPLAPIGAGILIGAGLSAGVGLATGTFDPWSVAIGGVVGGITGGVGTSGASMTTTVLVGAGSASGGSIADQAIARGKGLNEINYTEVAIAGALGGAGSGAGKYFSRGAAGAVDDVATDVTRGVPSNAANSADGALNTLPSSGKMFVTTPRGTVYDIPEGWAPRVSDTGKGIVYQEPGSIGNANSIRIMEPTPKYPDGYVRVYNGEGGGQPIDVFGNPGPQSATHIPETYRGPWAGWPE